MKTKTVHWCFQRRYFKNSSIWHFDSLFVLKTAKTRENFIKNSVCFDYWDFLTNFLTYLLTTTNWRRTKLQLKMFKRFNFYFFLLFLKIFRFWKCFTGGSRNLSRIASWVCIAIYAGKSSQTWVIQQVVCLWGII